MKLPELREIYRAGFGDGDAFLDYFFTERFHPRNTVTAERDGKTVSALYLFPRRLEIGNRTLSVSLLSAAATLPEYRGRGILAEVVQKALKASKARGDAAVVLSPFREGYYERFGFGVFARVKRAVPDLSGLTRRPLGKEDWASALAVFAAYERSFGVSLTRGKVEMRERLSGLLDEGDEAELFTENGAPRAYLIREEGAVTEFAAVPPAHFTAESGETVPVPSESGCAAGMLKPLDLFAIAEAAECETDGVWDVEVTDDFFPENAGCYRLTARGKAAALSRGGRAAYRVTSEELALALLGVREKTPEFLKNVFAKNLCFIADQY